ncbi:TolC family protein [Hymenobacter sp. BT188]|nr:TolC family protein [Hymenobacter sp. BT188]
MLTLPAHAQQVISLDSALAGALRVSPVLRQSGAEQREQEALRRGAFSLINPGVIVESPTGAFYTLGAQQTFEFPTVYTRQAQVGRAQVTLAQRNQQISRNIVQRDVRLSYLALQIAEAQQRQLASQDSLLRTLATASERLYNAGEVDYLQRVSTEAESRQAANRLQQAAADRHAAQVRLGLLLGQPTAELTTGADLMGLGTLVLPPSNAIVPPDSAQLQANPQLAFASQNIEVSRLNLRLARARALPGVVLGYQNQGERDSPVRNRFQAGLSLPLYFWTYRSQVQAADARLQASLAQRAATTLEVSREYQQALADVAKFEASVRYFQQTGLPQSKTIVSTAQRLFKAGEVSYYLFVQSVNQAFQIRTDYLDAVRGYQEALIQLNFLRGQ